MPTDPSPQLPQPQAKVLQLPIYSRAAGLDSVRWVASSNESPVAPSPKVVQAVARSAEAGQRYPAMFGEGLTAELAREHGLAAGQILPGGGSLSVLQAALTAYAGPGTEVVYAWRSYEAYPIAVRISGAEPVQVPLTPEHRHDLDAMAAAVTDKTAAVIICNPNNPTGTALTIGDIRRFLEHLPSRVLVVLDEAYREFLQTETDGVDLLPEFPNLLVMRTFSKAYGLAGIRAGYAMAAEPVVETLRRVATPFGLSRLAEAAALAALGDTAHMRHIVATICAERNKLYEGLVRRGVAVPRSHANFVWIPTAEHAQCIVAACLARGVSVRAFPGEGVRITAGEPEVTAAVLDAIDSLPQLGLIGPSVATRPGG